MFGHSISKSNIKTKRRFNANIRKKSFYSESLGKDVIVKISNRGIRTIYKHGSIDNFVLTTKTHNLTDPALKLKRKLKRRLKVAGEATK